MLRNSISKKLGLLALAPLALAMGSVHAGGTCTNDNLAVWSATTALGGTLTVADGGLGGTACRLDVRLTSAIGASNALVRDNSPSDEPRYRGSFILNADGLTGQNLGQAVRVFSATTAAPANGVADLVRFNIFGNISGTSRTLAVVTADADGPGFVSSASVPLAAGENRIEFDWQKGNPGTLRVWVNSNDEGTPTATITVNSAAWGGVDSAFLGLANSAPGFRSAQLNRDVQFDEFDSRRQSFIGF